MTKKKILEIQNAELSVLKNPLPTLTIKAFGTVRQGGWKDAELVPYVYIQEPPDGIHDFDFVAEPPNGSSASAIRPIEATYTLDPLTENLKGIRIHVEENSDESSKEFLLQ